ncbi:hypothetical protein D3C72_2300680 [compost metagenome]
MLNWPDDRQPSSSAYSWSALAQLAARLQYWPHNAGIRWSCSNAATEWAGNSMPGPRQAPSGKKS